VCGIAGLIYKEGEGPLGRDMTAMCHSLVHRGPDSTGYALYGDRRQGDFVAWCKIEEANPLDESDYERFQKDEVLARIERLGGTVRAVQQPLTYAFRIDFSYEPGTVPGEQGTLAMKRLIDTVEAVGPGVEITGVGRAMELIKDVGVATHVSQLYGLDAYRGTHAIAHTRMATESNIDVSHAHPFWAYPYLDISVVHNGQITNYWKSRRLLERRGHRFRSKCDSELIAVYVAWSLQKGKTLDEVLHDSMGDLDGVFTYLVATADELGMAKDELAAKPLVVAETDQVVLLASEEVALRQVVDEEIDSFDPFDSVVMTWQKPTRVGALA
jgi:hypothetical protein